MRDGDDASVLGAGGIGEGLGVGNGDDEIFGAWRGKGRFVFKKKIYLISKFFIETDQRATDEQHESVLYEACWPADAVAERVS